MKSAKNLRMVCRSAIAGGAYETSHHVRREHPRPEGGRMNHTKEPWNTWKNLYPRVIISEFESEDIARVTYIEDAQRIVACVNACSGITDAVIEDGIIKKALIAYLGSYDKSMTWNSMKVWEDV